MKRWIMALAAIVSVSSPALAIAEDQPVQLQGTAQLERQVVENGKTRVQLVQPDVVVPGDRILFTTRYQNTGRQAVQNFVVTNPLPSAVALSDEDAAALTVSVDGGRSWGRLAALSVTGADGKPRAAVAGDVTHVRWVVPAIAPGSAGVVTFHATVR